HRPGADLRVDAPQEGGPAPRPPGPGLLPGRTGNFLHKNTKPNQSPTLPAAGCCSAAGCGILLAGNAGRAAPRPPGKRELPLEAAVQTQTAPPRGNAPLFANRDLLRLLWPLVIEQTLAALVGMSDTVMVSSVGEAAISGVSLVDMINNL